MSIDQNKKGVINYKVKGFIGMLIGIIGVLIGVGTKILFVTPLSLLFSVFFVGYQKSGKIKDGVKWVLILVAFVAFVILITYMRK